MHFRYFVLYHTAWHAGHTVSASRSRCHATVGCRGWIEQHIQFVTLHSSFVLATTASSFRSDTQIEEQNQPECVWMCPEHFQTSLCAKFLKVLGRCLSMPAGAMEQSLWSGQASVVSPPHLSYKNTDCAVTHSSQLHTVPRPKIVGVLHLLKTVGNEIPDTCWKLSCSNGKTTTSQPWARRVGVTNSWYCTGSWCTDNLGIWFLQNWIHQTAK